MKALGIPLAALAVFNIACMTNYASAQEMPEPSPEHKLLLKDVGEWTIDIKVWGPGLEKPAISKGTKTVKMLGNCGTIVTNRPSIGCEKSDSNSGKIPSNAARGFILDMAKTKPRNPIWQIQAHKRSRQHQT